MQNDDSMAGNIFLSACLWKWTMTCSGLVKQFSESEVIKGDGEKHDHNFESNVR